MHTCTTPNASVTLYYIHNRALLAYDTLLHRKDKDAEQYHMTIPEYHAPNISYKKKPVDISQTSTKRTRKCRNTSAQQEINRNVLMTFFLCHFLYQKQSTSWKQVIHSTYCQHNQCVNDQ